MAPGTTEEVRGRRVPGQPPDAGGTGHTDGGLDYDAAFRAAFDWCVAAVHSAFELDRAAQTRRIIRAMEDPAVNVIGHLSGRMIGRRPGIDRIGAARRQVASVGACRPSTPRRPGWQRRRARLAMWAEHAR